MTEKNIDIKQIADFLETNTFNKILNKLTDFAENLSEGKLSGIINYNYNLNREQTIIIKELLIKVHAVSKIYVLAMKGSHDLEEEFISNIFSEHPVTGNLPVYLALRTLLENRLSHQIQQYNMNMGKSNNTLAMPINELRGHTKTYEDLSKNNTAVSPKAQHGIIAASLHDSYVRLINKSDWWNDKTYMKYFLNGDDPSKPRNLALTKEPKISLDQIHEEIKNISYEIGEIKSMSMSSTELTDNLTEKSIVKERSHAQKSGSEKMMQTPFGNRYGHLIDKIIAEIYLSDEHAIAGNDIIKDDMTKVFEDYKNSPDTFIETNSNEILKIVEYLIPSNHNTKTLVENFLKPNKKDIFSKFYNNENKIIIDNFISTIFEHFFEIKFVRLFKIIKSIELKKYACAFIIKRIYILYGENINHFGYFLVKTIANAGGLKK